METPKTLQEAIQCFSDFENCRQFMISVRWPDGVVRCPTCDSEKVTFLQKARLYKCYGDHPRPKFSLKVGTVFEDSPIPLEKWLPAFWLVVNCKNGISSWELHRALGVTQKTAWFMLHRLRLAMRNEAYNGDDKLGGGNGGGPVEVDETFVGAPAKNQHKSRRLRLAQVRNEQTRGDIYPGKAAVMAMLDREQRCIRAKVIPNLRRDTLQSAILDEVHHGSRVYTDQAMGYQGLAERYVHEVVNHMERYVDGQVHTNGLENFWSLFKRTLRGTYVAVEPFHLQRYADEQVFRFENRATKDNPLNDSDRFMLAVSQIVGKRLTYDELTGKATNRLL
ncbi:MAG: IS1595 family transposase [Candidatus Korobacteraceae bacterium]